MKKILSIALLFVNVSAFAGIGGSGSYSSGSTPSGSAGGGLTGTYPNPTIAVLPAISGAALTGLTPANIAAGSLPVDVIASSIALASVQSGSIVSLDASKVNAGSLGASVMVSSVAAAVVQDLSIVGMSSSKLSGALPAVSGAAITGVTLFASSRAVSGMSVASATDVQIATVTMSMRGNRIAKCILHTTINNGAGSARDYTYSIYVNSVLDSDSSPAVQTNSGTSTEFVYNDAQFTSVAGVTSCTVVIKSSNATGAQTLLHPDVELWEF